MFTSQHLMLLYIEPNPDIRKKTTLFLRNIGLNVFEADNAISGFDLFRTHKIDIILIHVQEPVENSYEFIRHLRNKNIMTPVIVTTTDTTKEVLLEAINLDITRYLVIPYPKEEMIEALHMAVKRVLFCHPLAYTDLHDGYSYDPINKLVNRPNGTSVKLSKKEHKLIELLLHSPGQVISYEVIEEHIWQDDIMSIDALRTLVRSVRKKTYASLIINHNGLGYRIEL